MSSIKQVFLLVLVIVGVGLWTFKDKWFGAKDDTNTYAENINIAGRIISYDDQCTAFCKTMGFSLGRHNRVEDFNSRYDVLYCQCSGNNKASMERANFIPK